MSVDPSQDTRRPPNCWYRDGDTHPSATEQARGSAEQHLTASLPEEKRQPPPAAPIPRPLDLPDRPTPYKRPVIDGRALAAGAGLEDDDQKVPF